ncbi:hypothetical protein ACJMK2_031497 [Sinanodonta woodiana]|uniref:FAS1 domain-containing protein n=1 Tax=Sinanodonta woodiana TaxID=1069815 RepID=A0ABD3X2I2_SINWO
MRSLQICVVFVILGSSLAYENKTVIQYLIDHHYSTFVRLLQDTHLDEVLKGSGPFTVFAPTNAAFAKLNPNILSMLTSNPNKLAELLKYHVVQEFKLMAVVSGTVNEVSLQGHTIKIEKNGTALLVNDVARIQNKDIVVANGVIHEIDSVLLPSFIVTESIAEIIIKDDKRFKDLALALAITNLTQLLESGDYTLFAPTDEAFRTVTHIFQLSTAQLKAILLNHVVPTGRTIEQINSGDHLQTQQGLSLTVTKNAGAVLVDSASVTDRNIMASNGVVHVINKVLVPTGI